MPAEAPGADHRRRLIEAMACALQSGGLRETTVADVVALARTSRRSFYEHFADREDCFLAVVDAFNDELMEAITEGVAREPDPLTKIDAAIDTFLGRIAAQPMLFSSLIRELPGLGDAGAKRQQNVVRSFVRLLVSLMESERREHPEVDVDPLTLDTATIIVGGLRELVVLAILAGRDVRELRDPAVAAVRAILLTRT